MKNLPLGIQSFEDIRSNHYLYVDKTKHPYRLATTGKVYSLSCPRRFGKSLRISALDALFRGRKELPCYPSTGCRLRQAVWVAWRC